MNLVRLPVLALLAACGGAPSEPPATAPVPAAEAPASAPAPVAQGARRDIDVAQLAADRDAGKVALLVDVRTPQEFAEGHVPGAVNIPLDTIAGRTGELSAAGEGEVYLVCRSGGRSSKATDVLVDAGFKAVNVQGGTMAWIAAEQPIEK